MSRKLSTPFANDSTLRNELPVTATTEQTDKGVIGYTNGFTSINKLPLANGGQPPHMEDFNGVLYDVTSNIVDINKGIQQYFDADYSTLVGGYPEGARLLLDNNSGFVTSLVDSNTVNPNTSLTNWVADNSVQYVSSLDDAQKVNGKVVILTSGLVGIYRYSSNAWNRIVTATNSYLPVSWFISANQDVSDTLLLGYNFDIDIDCYISKEVDLTTDYQSITGNGTLTINSGAFIKLLGSIQDFTVKRVVSNRATYCVYEKGYNNLIKGVNFHGDIGNYILSSGNKITVDGCHQIDSQQITPFVFDDATDFLFQNCTLNTYHGFGVQARWCNRGRMINNRSQSKIFSYTQQGVSGTKTYTFTADKAYSRNAVMLIDSSGNKTAVQFATSNDGAVYTITLENDPSTNTIELLLCDSLETYQINSGCIGVEIVDNSSDGTGDSNIVVGCDYRFDSATQSWVLDPANVQLSDYPSHNVIRSNTAINAFFSNIAVNNSRKFVTIDQNRTGNAGMAFDINAAHQSNILCSFDGVISKNTFDNDGYTLNAISAYRVDTTSYDENQGGLTISSDNEFANFSTHDPRNSLNKAILVGADSEPVARRQGINMTGVVWNKIRADLQTIFEADFVNNMPVATSDWSFANAYEYMYKDTDNRLSGKNSVYIAGAVIDMDAKPALVKELSGKMVKVRGSFNGTGKLNIFLNFPGSDSSNLEIDVSSTSFVQKEISFPTPASLQSFKLRMSEGKINFQNIEILYTDIP